MTGADKDNWLTRQASSSLTVGMVLQFHFPTRSRNIDRPSRSATGFT